MLLVEVLSEPTEKYDRGKKFEHYRQIASLEEYLMIGQNSYDVELYTRNRDGSWTFSSLNTQGASVVLSSVQCTLRVEDIYEKVETGEEAAGNK
jgi:Uma2 family endonuclease